MRRAGPLLALILLGAGSLSGEAQPARDAPPPAKLAGASARAAGRLATADARIEQKQWSEAFAELQALLDESADELVALHAGRPDHGLAVRQVYPLRLAALPGPALKLYRARFDAQAQRWLDEAVAARDVAQLRRIVDEAFISRPAERAIDLLGDLALARGDFAEARRWWRMLAVTAAGAATPKPSDRLTPAYPDPQIDPALIRAKLILAVILAGDRSAARAELAAFRTAHAKSGGLLAGKDGGYADTLQALLDRGDAPPAVELTDWPTFAGTPERNGVASAMPRVRWLEEPWRARLDGQPVQGVLEPLGRIENPATAARALTVHPVIVGRRVLFADHHSVTALDLRTGRKLARFDLLDDPKTAHLKSESARQGERHTLTVAGDRIYARLGGTAMGLARDSKDAAAETVGDSFIVCLGLTPVGEKLPVHWRAAARDNDKDMAVFEGSPLVDAGRAWVARLRCQRNLLTTEIDCYDAQTGARRWRQEVCESQEGDEPRHRQQLLTLAGANVVYCSHSGAIVALDAATGKRAWSVRYPRRGYRIANGFASPRDLAPCLYADGRLYVAPTDADALYCLDARTGRTLWRSRPLEVGHLLGVVKNRVIFTTAATPQGIRALDATTGADLRHWLHPSGGHDELPSLGRGVLAGDKVIWPTIHGLRILDQDDGQVSTQDFVPLNGVRPGNIAVGDGCIVIATERELHGYVAPRLFLEQRRKDAAAQPKSAPALFRLALAEADLGRYDAALATLEAAKQCCGEDDVTPADAHGGGLRDFLPRVAPRNPAGGPLRWRDAATWIGSDVLLTRALATLHQDDDRFIYDALVAEDTPFLPMKQRVWQELACQATRRGFPDAAEAGWNGLKFLPDVLIDAVGGPQRAEWLSLQQQVRSQKKHPAHVPSDKAIADEVKAWQQKHPDWSNLRVQAEVLDRFPFAALPREASLRLAKVYQDKKDEAPAAAVIRRLLRVSPQPQQEAPVLAELALCYERQQLWEPARSCWLRLATDLGDQRLTVPGVGTAREIATKRLAEPHFQPKRVLPPDLALPLACRWRHLLGDGSPAVAEMPRGVAVAAGKSVSALGGENGKKLWQHSGGHSITWLHQYADTLIACGPRSLQQFQAQDGAVNWTINLADASDDDFGAFQLVAGRLFCLQGQRRLLAIDVEVGRVLWHCNAPGAEVRSPAPNGRFRPDYLATAERVLLQTGRGAVVLLDARTGEAISATEPNDDARPQAPVRVGARRACLVHDPRHLVLIDLDSGKEVWRQAFGHPTTLSGEAPQLLCEGDDLLVLVPRNYGYELSRLDVGTGEPTRSQPLRFHTPTAPQLSTGAIVGGSLYFAVGDLLQAQDLLTGRRLWQTPLPVSGRCWQVIPTKNALLVVPDQATTAADGQYLWRRWLGLAPSFAVPTSRSTPSGVWTAATAAVSLAQSPSKANIVAVDPRDGKVLQSLDVKGQGSALETHIVGSRLIVAFAGSVWGLQ